MTYKKIIQCEKCKKEIIARSSLKRFCVDCKKLNRNEWRKNWLKKEDNLIKHKEIAKLSRNKKTKQENQKRYSNKHPNKIKAHRIAQEIPLKSSCQICGDTQNLERHHWRYDKPLMVATLCKFCHTVQHNKNVMEVNL